MTRKFRLSSVILACFGTLVVLSLGFIIALNSSNSVRIFSKLLGQTVVRSIDGLELSLRAYLDAASHQADFLTEHIHAAGRLDAASDALAQFVSGSMAAAPQISGVLIVDASGNALGVRRGRFGGVEWERPDVQSDPQLLGFSEFMRQTDRPFWSEPVFSEPLSGTVLSYNEPIWLGDEYLGLVAVAITTKELSNLANELSEPPNSRVFVLYDEDKVLAHSYLVVQPGNISAEKPLLHVSDVLDPVIQDLASVADSPDFLSTEGASLGQVEVAGIRYGVVTKPVEDYGQLPLILGSYFDGSGVRELMGTIIRTVLISAGILAAGLLVVFALSRAIAKPIRQTSEVATAVAALDFEGIKPLKQARIREIDDLSASFNAMLVGLQSFGRYVPRNLVRQLIRENRVGAGIEERKMTVMFTDIAGFTQTCEGMSPPEVADFINHHLTLVSRCIQAEGGTIDKYIGDAVMAFWGAPDSVDDPSIRAVRAAAALRSALAEDNAERAARGLAQVRIRIGIHSGDLIVGDIGSPERINYTVIGDVVNTAQRLEGLGKDVDGGAESIVLVSRTVKDGVDGAFPFDEVGPMKLKGKQGAVEVFRLVEGGA